MPSSLPVISKTYEIYKFIIEANSTIPRKFRFSLGSSMEKSILELLDNLILSKNAPKTHKSAYLIKYQSLQEILIIKNRLLLELKLVNPTKIFQINAKLNEIGKMIGGWLKSI
ncbi:hypothetical protein GF354_06665 [Candidatus Peregrinibacteria bacterium]|nr:hypothetical protein [Candidatus Peregrinibacteria bacterium]